jgi:hypothetical protein
VASGRLLRRALKRKPKVRKFLEDRAGEKAAQVGRYWKETFDAEGQEAWWTDFLAHHTRKPGAIQDVGPDQSRILRHSANRQREDTSNE